MKELTKRDIELTQGYQYNQIFKNSQWMFELGIRHLLSGFKSGHRLAFHIKYQVWQRAAKIGAFDCIIFVTDNF